MQSVRRAQDRGQANFGWLDSRHTFSFGSYFDPKHMGFGPLRVINEDVVAPGRGFDTHGHRDMEIISYVLSGALAHEDSIGHGSVIRPGEIQRMSAGTGVRHSEYNHSDTDPLRFLQIWIMPDADGLTPGYEQQAISEADTANTLKLVGSSDGRDGSVLIHQDVDFFVTRLADNAEVSHELRPGRIAWIQVAAGAVDVNGTVLQAGDGMAIETASRLRLIAAPSAEVLLFDMTAN